MTDSILNTDWPAEDLEQVSRCPMCGAGERALAYPDVQDWTFRSAPGKWNYYCCSSCSSLYLATRPTLGSMGRAYASYYTHSSDPQSDAVRSRSSWWVRLRNECMFHWYGIEQSPRLNLRYDKWLWPLRAVVARPFPFDLLRAAGRGRLIDVGCGNGNILVVAKGMGYSVRGIEPDPAAVAVALARGVTARVGSYQALGEEPGPYQYIVSSHVLEHVHDPKDFLQVLVRACAPGTQLLLSWPNPRSLVLSRFGRFWRGLEAPRHLCIPTAEAVIAVLRQYGEFHVRQYRSGLLTVAESWRMSGGKGSGALRGTLWRLASFAVPRRRQDFVALSCVFQGGPRSGDGRLG